MYIVAEKGGDKPLPLQANLYLKSSGGVYPRLIICKGLRPREIAAVSILDLGLIRLRISD